MNSLFRRRLSHDSSSRYIPLRQLLASMIYFLLNHCRKSRFLVLSAFETVKRFPQCHHQRTTTNQSPLMLHACSSSCSLLHNTQETVFVLAEKASSQMRYNTRTGSYSPRSMSLVNLTVFLCAAEFGLSGSGSIQVFS